MTTTLMTPARSKTPATILSNRANRNGPHIIQWGDGAFEGINGTSKPFANRAAAVAYAQVAVDMLGPGENGDFIALAVAQ